MARKRRQRRENLKTGRVTHRFELKLTEPVENELDLAIQKLKDDSQFASTMREALLLKITLNEGRVDVLYDQHPEIVQRLSNGNVVVQPPLPMSDNSEELKELRKQNEQLKQMIEGLTELVTALNRSGGYVMQSAQPPALSPAAGQGGLKQIDGFKALAAPVFDDEEETLPAISISKQKRSGSENFLSGLMSLRVQT